MFRRPAQKRLNPGVGDRCRLAVEGQTDGAMTPFPSSPPFGRSAPLAKQTDAPGNGRRFPPANPIAPCPVPKVHGTPALTCKGNTSREVVDVGIWALKPFLPPPFGNTSSPGSVALSQPFHSSSSLNHPRAKSRCPRGGLPCPPWGCR